MLRGVKGLLLGITIGLFGSLFGFTTYGIAIEKSIGLAWLFKIRGIVNPQPKAVIIAIDGTTSEKLGLPSLPREWPRSIHGVLVDALVSHGASTIVLDIDFHKPRSADEDQRFADAVRKSGRVVMIQHLTGKRQPLKDKTGKSRGSAWIEELHPPVDALANASRGLGPFPLPQYEAAVHEFWVYKGNAGQTPTLPAVALQVYALKIYDQFHRLLDNGNLLEYVDVPKSASVISSAEDLHKLMSDIRGVLLEKPELTGRLVLELNRPWVDREPVETRQLLTALVSMYIGDDKRYLNFYGPPGTIETVSYHAIIQDQLGTQNTGQADLGGKVVFVGYSDFYDPVQPDRFYTVFTSKAGIDLSGVEIAATAFDNLLYNQSLRVPDDETTLVILFCFGFSIALLIYFMPANLGVPASIAIVAGYIFYAQVTFKNGYLWLPLSIPVLFQFPLALFIGLLAQYLRQRSKVKHFSKTISLYIPEGISKALGSGDFIPERTNQVTFSTCLATDMEGFTTIAEKMKPGEVAVFLNDYFDTLAKPLLYYDVTVTEFRADSIMCAWTGQVSNIEMRKKPILASLQAEKAIEDFKARHDVFKASLRIGLETGEVFIGHSGGGGHFVYSIVGDCANTASRIEGLNKYMGTQILASESVVEGIENLLIRPIGNFIFVGKTGPTPIVEILALSNEATERQVELCERFAIANNLFLDMEWERAYTEYKSILNSFPHDGPSRFFISQCHQKINAKALPEHPWVINMTQK